MRASRAHRHNLVTCTRSRAPRRSSGPPAPAVPSTARQTHLPRRSAVRRSSPDGVAADSATPRVTRTSSRLRPPRRSSATPSDLFFSRFFFLFFSLFSSFFFLFFPRTPCFALRTPTPLRLRLRARAAEPPRHPPRRPPPHRPRFCVDHPRRYRAPYATHRHTYLVLLDAPVTTHPSPSRSDLCVRPYHAKRLRWLHPLFILFQSSSFSQN